MCQLEFEHLLEYLKNGLFESYAVSSPAFPFRSGTTDGLTAAGGDCLEPRSSLQSRRVRPRSAADQDHPSHARTSLPPLPPFLSLSLTHTLRQDQYGEEWESLCREQNAHAEQLETLRRANAQLSAQVRNLEASLSQINVEHCDLVRQVVIGKLEREELEDELVKCAFASLSMSLSRKADELGGTDKIAFAEMAHQQASDGAQSHRLSNGQQQQGDSREQMERRERLSRGSVE